VGEALAQVPRTVRAYGRSAEARERLGEEGFAHTWAEGQAMTLEQAAEYALQNGQDAQPDL
jgi:hypothetical protein